MRRIQYAEMLGTPVVVKADGLAAGKGVAICASLAEAEQSIRAALEGGRFGEAGTRVVVEQLLERCRGERDRDLRRP